jgi:hypothetical protein
MGQGEEREASLAAKQAARVFRQLGLLPYCKDATGTG